MAHYMLRGARQNSVYLGANVPLETILSTADYIQADHLLLFLVHKENETDVKRFLSELNKKFSGNHIYVACSGDLVGINHGKKVRYLSSAEELISILNNV